MLDENYFGDRTRYDGTPLLHHSVKAAQIVVGEIGLGRNSTHSPLLHDVVRLAMKELDREQSDELMKQIEQKFGSQVVGVTKALCNISDIHPKMS